MKAYELPDGWEWTALGEICEPVEWVDPRTAPRQKWRYVDISSIDSTKNQISEVKEILGRDAPSRARQLIRTGDILFSTVRTYLRKLAVVPEEYDGAIASTGFCVLRFADGVEPRLIFHYLRSDEFTQSISSKQRGKSYPAVADRDIFAEEVPLPPTAEQVRITTKIETLLRNLDFARGALDKLHDLLKRYRQVVLVAAYEGLLTERITKGKSTAALMRMYDGRSKKNTLDDVDTPKIFYGYDSSNLPEGWEWVTLPQIGELARGKSTHRPRNDERLFGGPYPFIQTGDIGKADGLIQTFSQTYNELGLSQSRLWPKGTLCITIAANIAETAILGIDACFPDSVVGFLPFENTCDIRFIEYFIRRIRDDLDRFAPAKAQKNINLVTLRSMAIPFPSLREQRQIADKIEALFVQVRVIEGVEEIVRRQMNREEQSILTRAFQGGLVYQDFGEEPSSKLLERISETLRLQKEAAQEVKKGRTVKREHQLDQKRNVSSPQELIELLKLLQTETTNPVPARELWRESGLTIDDFYLLLKDTPRDQIQEKRQGQTIYLEVL